MAAYCPTLRSAYETITRFNIPTTPQLLLGKRHRPLQPLQPQTVTPAVYSICGKNRTLFKLRHARDLQDLALGGNIEYQCGDTIEMAWTNDGVQLMLRRLVPHVVATDRIVFHGSATVVHNGSTLVTLPEVMAPFLLDQDLLVPQEVLDTLELQAY